MSTNTWPRPNVRPATGRPGSVSAKSLFLRSRKSVAPAPARTPIDRQPIVPPQVTKPRKSCHSDRRDLNRIQKNQENERQQDSRAELADKFSESLEQYRETLHSQAGSGLNAIENNLTRDLEELAVNVEAHFQKLGEIGEPLQKPFVAEALTKAEPDTDASAARTHEVLLQDSVSEFRKLNEEKGNILRRLWEEWEDAQFEIMSLAVELFGKDSISVVQLQIGNIGPGQQERLDDMLKVAEHAYDESHRDHADFRQDLRSFEESMGQISNKAKKTAKEIHDSHVQKKEDEMRQLTNLIRKITED
ncbi:hypothetical protein H2200_008005 [Cladophialophora chaetospira]|uniref:Uncharacterized protein n=1 Tax=Cladophialophora chaetospira TaxID=386627 RepID=A0AA38X6X9_9EURO|nr:hypothetical protein H2200_008005 [Cladophialophora chaetospira]